MPARLVRHRLGVDRTSAEVLRTFRDRPGLFGLIGAWHDGRTVIGFDPVRPLPVGADPFEALGALPSFAAEEGFGGGWVGALGYRLGARIERLPPSPPRPVPLADFTLHYYDHVLVHDQAGWWFEALVDDDTAGAGRIETSYDDCRRALAAVSPGPRHYEITDFVATPDAAGHREAVARTLERLAAGDIFQANVCRRFEAELAGDPLDVFCAGVEALSPPYAAFLRTADGAIASLSPELFLRRNGRHVRTSPIKGTAPSDADAAELGRRRRRTGPRTS